MSILGIVGLWFAWYQIRQARLWNKLHAAFTFLPHPLELEQVESELDQAINFWISDVPLTEELAKALMGDLEDSGYETLKLNDETVTLCRLRMLRVGHKLKRYVNLIEMYCVAINSGVVDVGAAYHIYSFKFVRHFNKLENYIKHMRKKKNDNAIYCELERVAKAWSKVDGIERKY